MTRLPANAFGLIAQLTLVVATVVIAFASPPASGAMLLVPVRGQIPGAALSAAIASGARILDRGPLPGSVVIDGDRDRLFQPLLARGVLLVAPPRRWCGA